MSKELHGRLEQLLTWLMVSASIVGISCGVGGAVGFAIVTWWYWEVDWQIKAVVGLSLWLGIVMVLGAIGIFLLSYAEPRKTT